MKADDYARMYIEIGGSPYKELVEVIESAMEDAANQTLEMSVVLQGMIDDKRYTESFDTWGGDYRRDMFNLLVNLVGDYKYRAYSFNIAHTKQGGAGMGAYPAEIKVTRQHKYGEK